MRRKYNCWDLGSFPPGTTERACGNKGQTQNSNFKIRKHKERERLIKE